MMLPSFWVAKTLPSAMSTPRFAQRPGYLGSTSETYSHKMVPVFALSAKMSMLPVGRYMTPSRTMGVASWVVLGSNPDPFKRVNQAPCRLLTLDGLFGANVKWRVGPQPPPGTDQFLPAGPQKFPLDCPRGGPGAIKTAATPRAPNIKTRPKCIDSHPF